MRLSRCLALLLGVFILGACYPAGFPPAVIVPASPATHDPGVAALLRSAPPAGTTVEVDAYFSGSEGLPLSGGPPPPDDQVACPQPWPAALTDRPFRPVLYLLNGLQSNLLPADAPWLVAVTPEATQPGARVTAQFPYHARFRGHLGDPAFAGCDDAARIFVVEEVVKVYESHPVGSDAAGLELPAGYADWPVYHDDAFGYSIAYPPGWHVDRLDDATVTLRDPVRPDYPLTLRVHPEEVYYDQYDPAAAPTLLQGQGFSVFEQGRAFGDQVTGGQHLAGYRVDHAPGGAGERSVSVLFPAGGRTYELIMGYPVGFDASQDLLAIYSAMVESLRLDRAPGPTATPPVRQALGQGPFLSQEEVLAAAGQRAAGQLELLAAQLVAESAAREMAQACNTFVGHPDGVWALTVRGSFDGQERTMRLFLDAASGGHLCGEEIAPEALPTAAPIPPATATPASAAGGGAPLRVRPLPATLTVGSRTQTAGIGTYCWNESKEDGEGAGLCVDMAGIPTASRPLYPASPFTASLRLPVLDDPPSAVQMRLFAVSDEDRLPGSDEAALLWSYREGKPSQLEAVAVQELDLSLDAGPYVLVIFATWPGRGDVTYGFLLDVVPG